MRSSRRSANRSSGVPRGLSRGASSAIASTQLDEIASTLADDYARIFEETFRPRGDLFEAPEWVKLLYDLPPRFCLRRTTHGTRMGWQVTHRNQFVGMTARLSRALKAAMVAPGHLLHGDTMITSRAARPRRA